MKEGLNHPEKLIFDTGRLPPAERIGQYRALYSIGAEVTQIGPDPSARVQAWRLDRAVLYDRRLNDIGHRRSPDMVAAGLMDHFTVTILIEGELQFDFAEGRRSLQPGEMLLADVRQPGANRARAAHLITVAMARDRLVTATKSVEALHGLVLPAERVRLFRDFLVSLVTNVSEMSKSATASMTKILLALLRITLADKHRADVNDRASERIDQLRQLITARLDDPDFDVDAVVRESGFPRATLYRLMQPRGGLASFIRFQRLEQIRRRLSERTDHSSFPDIARAAGFVRASQAAQQFEALYDIRPAAYRAAILSATSENSASELMRLWQYEVRSSW